MNADIISELIEVRLHQPDHFHVVRETLERIGVPSKNEKILSQSCHILHKKGKYYIVSFKELFKLDGRPTTITEDDIGRRNTIANKLAEWKLVELVDPDKSKDPTVDESEIKILTHREKGDWILVPKYNIGGKKRVQSKQE